MKLLLTSNGLCNQSIVHALQNLVEKPFAQSSLVFIPTAADLKDQDKSWLINDLYNVKKCGFSCIDIVDIAALPVSVIVPRLEKADVLLFGGGHTLFLLYWLEKTGLKTLLPTLLASRVYMGISAGSIAASNHIVTTTSTSLPSEFEPSKNNEGLGLVDFALRPHYTSLHFPEWTDERLARIAQQHHVPVYAIDDQTAVQVVDGKVSMVSEGKYHIFSCV